MRSARYLRVGLVFTLLTATDVAAQSLVSLDFAATPVGDFPANITMVDGVMEVVNMNGQHMLRASAPSAFLIRLPQILPTDFTVEVDLVPKVSGNENDIGLEGTPTINQGTASAYLLWQSEYLRVIGGDVNNFETKVPDALAVSTQGVLTRVTVVVQGTTMKVYTNGRLLSTLSNRRFVRGPVLRVFLGGQDDGSSAVHLAALRVTGSALSPTSVAAAGAGGGGSGAGGSGGSGSGAGGSAVSGSGGSTSGRSGSGRVGSGSGSNTGNTSGSTSTIAITNLTVTDTPAGPLVNWQGVPSAVYTVQRWLIANPTCCASTSPASPPLTLPSWQDTPLPMSGTYLYTVTARTSSASASAQAQFSYQLSGGGQTPPPPPPAPASATSGRYRVTLTGFRVATATLDPPQSPDGSGDEVYAAAAAVVWDRSTSTVRSRTNVTTKEYGQLGVDPRLYPNRVVGGTMTPNGGIWTGKGVEQIPAQYDPAGSSIPAHTTDRFPIVVWEGVLNDGKEALLVIPSLWERDIDPSLYNLWANQWSTMPLTQHLQAPPLMGALAMSHLTYVSWAAPGPPIAVPFPEMTANVRDLPIGMVPQPLAAPVAANYLDRHVFITRENLGALQTVGASTILPIPYSVTAATTFARGDYTLYLRVERLQ